MLRGRYYYDSLIRKGVRHTSFPDVTARKARPVIQSVDRAIRVLTALQGARRMSLSELAARLDLAPSTTHGIVRTLVEHGMVVQERGSSRYQLGPAVLRLGNVYLDTLELRTKAIPWAEDLARRTGMAVRTGVLLIDDVVIIQHEPRPDGSRQMPEVGIVIPAHASALGKAMLAFMPEDTERMLASGDLRSMTGETLTSPDDIRAQLEQIRATGIAREQDEAVIGEAAAASPVFDAWGGVVGAIGVVISGLADTDTDPGELVRETARSLSRELGAQTWPPPARD
jgi:DNA-binding IclR family transcriptional regulator